MANPTKKRIFYFDALRALAILLVILCHSSLRYKPFVYTSFKVAMPAIFFIATHVAVPIFFMLSGALLLNRTYTLSDFFKRRFSRVLYPFIFWVIVAVFVALFGVHHGPHDAFKIVVGSNRWTWFVWVMMGIYLFIPVVNSFIKEYKMTGVKFFLAIWFVTVVLFTFGKYPFYRFELSYFANYIGYVVLGYYLANAEFRWSDLKIAVLGFITAAVFLAIDFYTYAKDIPSVETKYLSLFVVVASIGVFLMFRHFARHCDSHPDSALGRFHKRIENGKIGAVILSLSTCSYGMYLVNSIIFKFLHDSYPLKFLPVIFIGVVVLSWLLVKLVSKIPYMSKFSGAA
jgi:surface polysaccharide O-acyltransferase-like enzyme